MHFFHPINFIPHLMESVWCIGLCLGSIPPFGCPERWGIPHDNRSAIDCSSHKSPGFLTFVSGPLSPWLLYHPIGFGLIDCRIAWQLSTIGGALGSDIIGRCSWALLPTLSTRDTFNPLSSRLNYRCVVSFFQDNCSLPLPEEWILDIAVRSE